MDISGTSREEGIAAGHRARRYCVMLRYAKEVTGHAGHRELLRESSSASTSARVLGKYLGWHMPRQRYLIVDDTWDRSSESERRAATALSRPGHLGATRYGWNKDPAHMHLMCSSGAPQVRRVRRQASGVRRQGASLTSLIWISGWLSVKLERSAMIRSACGAKLF